MREGAIIQGLTDLETMKRAMIEDHLSMTHELVLMRTRIDALEKVLLGSRLSLLSAVVVTLFSPSWMARLVQKMHTIQIQRFNAQMKAQKPGLVKPEGGLCVS